ncbi:hypothetical protein [Glacieibacterium frigidum]|uniref:EF-hand domain-containing protein n=1 Tax=Glacieibacterium frigidum TaxID=2593303 RepID=A0A552U7T0_9SPHN|nr:hypothetical protein [Glacieibacterium frigidum]TRW14229.1 hypothetical protein FMM06_10955 [Glacieibacterium frigidum]
MIRIMLAMGLAMLGSVGATAAPTVPSAKLDLKPVQRVIPRRNIRNQPILEAARNGSLNKLVLTRAAYLDKMRFLHGNKDWNQDGVVSWQGANAPENLADFAKCVIVDYQYTPASTVKDKTKPGQMITTPAKHSPIDWRTFLEVLGETKFEGGECEVIGVVDVTKCLVGNTPYTYEQLNPPAPQCVSKPNAPCIPVPKNPYAGVGKALFCLANPKDPSCAGDFAKLCAAKGGTLKVFSKMQGCEKYQTFGPDSTAALLKVAALNFDSEDWNQDGKISGKEGEFLCKR